jgi:pSer/pThr/pTyr-binding forkhead associated (FHA) protein
VSEQLIDVLKLCLLALLYLFFIRVMWAVWSELRTPAVAPASRTAPRRARAADPATGRGAGPAPTAQALVIVEPADQAGREYPVTTEMTLGRAPGCTVVIDDTYASQIHARVAAGPDGIHVEDLGSTNGTTCNGEPVTGPRRLRRGDRIGVGTVVLELR